MSRKKITQTEFIFGKKLRLIRKKYGYSQAETGTLLGVTGSYISDLERGKAQNPSALLIGSIEKNFSVSRNWLFSEDMSLPLKNNEPSNVPEVDAGVCETVLCYSARPSGEKWRLLEMAERILDSGTEYKEALSQNIRAFHSAVTAVEKIERQSERLESMEHRIAALEGRKETGSEG